jgi:hypothetical protein
MNDCLHLLLTVLVTEKRLKIHPGLDIIPGRNRVDLFLASLSSLSELPIHSADLFIELDETTQEYESLIREKIREFPFRCRVHDYRLQNFKQWQTASAHLPESSLLLLLTYDDHALLPDTLDEFMWLKHQVQDAYLKFPYDTIVGQLSHFPETIACSSVMNSMRITRLDSGFSLVPLAIPIGAILIPADKFSSWWEADFTNGAKIVGPENPFGASVTLSSGYSIGPRRELFRHLDGYSHVNIKSPFYAPVIIKNGASDLPKSPRPNIGNDVETDLYIESISAVRFTPLVFGMINSFFPFVSHGFYSRLARLFFTNKTFRRSVFKGFAIFPMLAFFRTFSPFFRRYFSSGKHRATLHLISVGASHGFYRLGILILVSIVKSRIRIFGVFLNR